MRFSAFLRTALGAALLSGCAPELPEDGSDDDPESKRSLHAWVVLERVEADSRVRTNVSAKFLQMADADVPLAMRLVGARPSVPQSGDCVPIAELDEMSLGSDRVLTLADEPAAEIDLVDVGDVSLSVPNLFSDMASCAPGASHCGRIDLAPRAFPDIGDFVSGVVYTSPDAAIGMPVPADYEIGGSGSTSVEAFLIDVRAPNAPRGVIVAGQALPEVPAGAADAADATGSDERPEPNVIVRAGADIELSWATDSTAGGDAGLVYIDVRGASAHRCSFPDRGAAVLPSDVLKQGDEEVTLSLHRLVEQRTIVRGSPSTEDAQEATVVFDFARAVRLTVRPSAR